MECQNCQKDCDELVTRQGFCITFFVEWICRECFEEIEGVKFSEYTEEDRYANREI